MTNVQYVVIEDIIASLNTLVPTYLKYVGEFPDDMSKVGQNFPAAIVQDGNRSYLINAGNVYKCFMEIYVDVYTEIRTGITKMEKMLDTEAQINDVILADLTLGATVKNTVLVSSSIESFSPTTGQQFDMRRITYMIEIHDTRS